MRASLEIRGEGVASTGFFIITKKLRNPSICPFCSKNFSIEIVNREQGGGGVTKKKGECRSLKRAKLKKWHRRVAKFIPFGMFKTKISSIFDFFERGRVEEKEKEDYIQSIKISTRSLYFPQNLLSLAHSLFSLSEMRVNPSPVALGQRRRSSEWHFGHSSAYTR